MNMNQSKLINVLIGKSILETVLVAVIAVGFYITAFPPYFHGWSEATSQGISGWAVNDNAPWERVSVQLFVDGNFIATQAAHLSRPDVAAAGWAKDEWHGYNFILPALETGYHEARVYAVHGSGGETRRTLQKLGDPIRFRVDQNGSLTDVSDRRPDERN
jgi:hypothetical protein